MSSIVNPRSDQKPSVQAHSPGWPANRRSVDPATRGLKGGRAQARMTIDGPGGCLASADARAAVPAKCGERTAPRLEERCSTTPMR